MEETDQWRKQELWSFPGRYVPNVCLFKILQSSEYMVVISIVRWYEGTSREDWVCANDQTGIETKVHLFFIDLVIESIEDEIERLYKEILSSSPV